MAQISCTVLKHDDLLCKLCAKSLCKFCQFVWSFVLWTLISALINFRSSFITVVSTLTWVLCVDMSYWCTDVHVNLVNIVSQDRNYGYFLLACPIWDVPYEMSHMKLNSFGRGKKSSEVFKCLTTLSLWTLVVRKVIMQKVSVTSVQLCCYFSFCSFVLHVHWALVCLYF